MIKALCVGLGGFIGVLLRYFIGLLPIKSSFVFPIKTFLINVLGCFVIGLISALVLKQTLNNENLEAFLKIGLCGGFTTFSTFAFESGELIKNGSIFIALIYIILSITLGILAVAFAQYIIK